MLVRFFVLSICVALGVCKIRLYTECPPDKGGVEGGNQLEVLKLNIANCPSTERSCTFYKGDTVSGEVRVKLNFTATALFISLSVRTKLLGRITLVDKLDGCDKATVGKCSKIKPGYQMKFEHSQTIDTNLPSFDGMVKVTITDSDDTVRFCGLAHIILKNSESDPTLPIVDAVADFIVK